MCPTAKPKATAQASLFSNKPLRASKCRIDTCRIIFYISVANYLILLEDAIFAQYISHIDQSGLRGNITFDIRNDSDHSDSSKPSSILEIEALIEADQSTWIQGDQNEEEFDSLQPIQFDWQLFANSLEPQMLSKCSNDHLGAKVGEEISSLLPQQKTIELNKLNRWSIGLSRTIRDIGSMVWGKSIVLKLAKVHEERAALERPKQRPKSMQPNSGKQIAEDESSAEVKPLSPPAKPALSRPQLAFKAAPTAASVAPPSKPTFAPRPKPNISARFNVKPTNSSSNSRIRKRDLTAVAALNSNQNQTSADTQHSNEHKRRERIVIATNRRILKLYGNVVVCANVIDVRNVKTFQASFESNSIGGSVTLRGNEEEITLISVNLYHIRSKVTTRHDWKLMASDILDQRRDEDKCKYLQLVLDTNSYTQSLELPTGGPTVDKPNRLGDLGNRLGQVQVAGQGRNSRAQLLDPNLSVSMLENSRSLFVVIYEQVSTKSNSSSVRPNILACALINSFQPKKLEAQFNMDGVRGSVEFSQRHPSEPTSIVYDLFGLEGNVKNVAIFQLPLATRLDSDNRKLCNSLGQVFGGQQVGNLTRRHGHLAAIDSDYEDHYVGDWLDLSVQLFGVQTIWGRSLVIGKNNGDQWVCATLEPVGAGGEDERTVSMVQAEARFHYPLVGRATFWQASGEPNSPTGVLVELYNPNGEKESEGHNWLVHLAPTMGDFYNWSQRCQSAGEVFDPTQSALGLSGELHSRQCQNGLLGEPLRCRAGDTSLKSNHKLELAISPANRRRHYYVDPYLPLAGPNSIVGKSLVVYDEFAPVQRGNRLACATIKTHHPLKAIVKHWDSGPSIPSNVRGSIGFEQEAGGKQTRAKIDLSGFNGNVEKYAIHQVWMTDDREFPCSNDSLYDIFDPFRLEHTLSLPPSAHYGASATVDRVKVGDLSRKHGSFEGLQNVRRQFRDNNLPLFAPNSIVGRSLVLRAAVNDFRWVCGNIELDYDKTFSRQIIALASFDEPRSKVSGFVRFVQVEHRDGSLSDTFIQVDLKLQQTSTGGLGERLESEGAGHNWAVFVNQVGEDAFISADEVRCIAAGFKWNPFLAQDNSDAYATTSCTPLEPEACAMGDLGLRHGLLSLAQTSGGRRAFSDSNLPLVGNHSIVGRSLVVFHNQRPSVKLACSNILLDVHLKSNVVVRQTPSFTVARFIEQMRQLLDATEWLMVPELRATKSVANGECIQMTIHFYGQRAHQMQSELNNLITLGTVRRSSRVGVEKISTHYRICRAGQGGAGTEQRHLTSGANSAPTRWPLLLVVAPILVNRLVSRVVPIKM